jgi:hypothetical protein
MSIGGIPLDHIRFAVFGTVNAPETPQSSEESTITRALPYRRAFSMTRLVPDFVFPQPHHRGVTRPMCTNMPSVAAVQPGDFVTSIV